MSLDTYSNLKTEIENHLDFDFADADVDTFIDLAESRHKKDVRVREMITRSALTVNDRYVNLPSGFLQMLSMRLLTSPVTVLDEKNHYEMNRIRRTGTGKPVAYVTHGTEIEFDIDTDQSYSGEITFYKAETALSDGNTTNNILTNYPDLYLFAALAAAERFNHDDERAKYWDGLYRNELSLANNMAQSRSGPLVSRVVGAPP